MCSPGECTMTAIGNYTSIMLVNKLVFVFHLVYRLIGHTFINQLFRI